MADPMERLRYLRAASVPTVIRPVRVIQRRWKIAAATGVMAIVAIPYYQSSMVVEASKPAVTVQRSLQDQWPDIWMVDQSETAESYSNGLRIEIEGAVHGPRRSYVWLDQATGKVHTGGTVPVGIVYHTTESHIAPFDRAHNGDLKALGRGILSYVRDDRSYHYLIDRFGRVHRVVAEQDAAGHAGYSAWADSRRAYAGLNHSFLGIAFELATEPGAESSSVATPAQIRAARELTEMLRSRYQILAVNCVTHAQVSISKITDRVGDHADWAGNFPFAEMGLPDNYGLPIAGIYQFGFGWDHNYRTTTGARVWPGLALSGVEQQTRARAQGLSVAAYRKNAQQVFKEMMEIQ